MSEKLNIQPEAGNKSPDAERSHEQHRPKAEHAAERSAESSQEQQERLSAIRNEVGREAHTTEELARADKGAEDNNTALPPVKRQLQSLMFERTLNRIRKELPAPQRALSKVIHNGPVEAISSVGEKTVARPYGLLGGGLAAFIGSLVTFYMARNYGFKYNVFLFFTFFIAGYILATLIEVGVRLSTSNKK